MKKRLVFALLIQLSLIPALAKSAEVNGPAEDLSILVSTALTNNPELKASEARWQMFASKAKQAKALDDPMVMFIEQSGYITCRAFKIFVAILTGGKVLIKTR